ncbi:MAG: hypothetical protein ABSF70_09180 [Terracidiphilus sp.]
MAMSHFRPDLTPAEFKVLHDSASSEDIPKPDEKAPRPEVRAEFLRWLATDPDAVSQIDPKGLRVHSAIIPGELDLQECHIDLTLVFRNCDFQRRINLRSAEMRGLFFLDSTLAEGIRADRVIVHGPLYLRRIESGGEICLLNARIECNLDCFGAKLKAEGDALSADGAKIGGAVFLKNSFESQGTIRLPGAEIAKDLSFKGAKVAGVVCQNTVVNGDLIWQRIEKSESTRLNLVGAKVRNLRDDRRSWPEKEMLDLDGLVYEDLTLHGPLSDEDIKYQTYTDELPLIAKERIDWIMLQSRECRTEPQPWMQLRDLLERKSDRKGAKYVLFRFRCLQAQKSWIPWRSCRKLYAWIEENPLRIGWSIALTLLIGTSIFTWGGWQHAMIETVRYQPNAIKENGEVKPVSPHYPKYQPFVYTLENAVPLVKLGMDDKWTPDPSPDFCRPWFPRKPWLYFISTYGILVFTRWALIVGGWIQATILAASVADRFKK